MRGQVDVSSLITLAVTSFLFLWIAAPALQEGVNLNLTNADSLTKALLLFIPTLFLIGALFWTTSFLKSKYGGAA